MIDGTTVSLAQYKRLRQKQREIHNRLIRKLPKEALTKCGAKLGILKNGVLMFETEDETSVLMDYCLYDYRPDGENAIEKELRERPPAPGTDERVLLDCNIHFCRFNNKRNTHIILLYYFSN